MKFKKQRQTRIAVLFALLFTLQACDVWTDESLTTTIPIFPPSDSSSQTGDSTNETSDVSGETEPAQTDPSATETTPSETLPTDPYVWEATFTPVTVPDSALVAAADETGLWQRWPSDLITPVQVEVDLSTYAGRAKSETALEGITVILDPGHGGKDPGAIGVLDGVTIYEKDINLAIALQTKARLEALGARVVMTRSADQWVSLYQRIAIAGNETISFWQEGLNAQSLDSSWLDAIKPELQKLVTINEDTVESGGRGFAQGMGVVPNLRLLMDAQGQTDQILYIAIHANSTDVTIEDKRGLQMYISTNQIIYDSEREMIALDPNDAEITPINPNYTAYNDADRLKLANSLYSSITGLVPELKQGEITAFAGNFAFLRELNLASVLVETGFMSNAADLSILVNPVQQAAIADGIADGVWHYFSN